MGGFVGSMGGVPVGNIVIEDELDTYEDVTVGNDRGVYGRLLEVTIFAAE